jgi:hypothetical protein
VNSMTEAAAEVFAGNRPQGSAFLIAPDLFLTEVISAKFIRAVEAHLPERAIGAGALLLVCSRAG